MLFLVFALWPTIVLIMKTLRVVTYVLLTISDVAIMQLSLMFFISETKGHDSLFGNIKVHIIFEWFYSFLFWLKLYSGPHFILNINISIMILNAKIFSSIQSFLIFKWYNCFCETTTKKRVHLHEWSNNYLIDSQFIRFELFPVKR